MKSFVWKLVIAFVFSYVFLMGALVFAYSQISRNFILNKAMESVENVHGGLATRLNAQVLFDYQKIGVMIAEFNALSLDPVEELKSRHHQIMVGTQSYIGFGEMTETGLEINDVTYLFLENFDEDDYAQNVAIYTFDGAFVNQTDSTLYIFFKFGDVVAYFDANTYLENIFDINSSLDPHLIIMSRDNRIFYQSEIADADYYLYNYLYHQGYDATYIQTIVERVNAQESFIINANILSASSFIAFAPLSETFSTRNLYFVSIFNQDDVVSGFSLLNLILLSVFFVVFILFSISLLMLFKILQNKNNDIENARLVHYYAKPYIIRINAKGIIKSYNKSFRNLLGDYDIYDKVGDFQLKDKYEDDTLEDIIRKQKAFTAIFQLGMQSVYIRFITIRAGRGYLLIGDDVTGIEGMFEEYKGLAMYDAITKLPNINYLMQDLKELFDENDKLMQKNALVTFDITAFSKIQLLLGERNSHKALIMVSELAKTSIDGFPATLYNTDVDNFVILFRNLEAFNWINRWAEKMQSMLEQPLAIDRNIMHLEIKIGTFFIEYEKYAKLTVDQAYDNMMLALNHAKQSSVHQIFNYDVGLSQVASREQMMEIDLATAIQNNEFYMVLQPQYHNIEERIVGFEALIRWNNPKYINESPLKFIEMAEKNNMIIDIGRIALHETLLIAKQLEPYNLHISLNVSPVQILQVGFVTEFISVFEQYELKKGSVSLEVTETFLISSLELVIDKLKLLQKYGFEIHLDDFGTGYSSLQYLRDLPISAIKIDRAFIKDIERDAHSRAIVTMISSLAKNVGLNVVAEGVENERQNLIVFKSGCHVIQGYYISPPVKIEDAVKLIEAYNIKKTKVVSVKSQTKQREAKK